MPSYATTLEAEAYFNNKLHAEPWECATADQRRRALAEATSIIDKLNFAGAKTSSDQDNQFPRDGLTEVPVTIRYASCEIALALLDGVDPQMEYENIALKSQAYGSLRANINSELLSPHTLAGVPSVTAWRYLIPYLRDPYEIKMERSS